MANAEAEWLEEQAAAEGELPAEVQESLLEAHQSDVALQAAQMAIDQRRADEAAEIAAKDAQPAELFALRAGHYVPIAKAKLKAAEPIFVKLPNGSFECIGTTDSEAQPPDVHIT